MKVIIPAGGLGKRLQPITLHRPKALIPLAGKPLIVHIIKNLSKQSFREIIIVLGHLGNKIVNYLGNGSAFNVNINYVWQKKPSGLANAILQAEEFVKDERFLVHHGDNLYSHLPEGLVTKHENDSVATVTIEKIRKILDIGMVRLKNDYVVKATDNVSDIRIAGLFYFEPVIFKALRSIKPSERGEYEISEAIQWLINKGFKVKAVWVKDWRININDLNDLLEANKRILGKISSTPVRIGKNCEIDPKTKIGPFVSIGDRARIERGVEIKNSILMDRVRVAPSVKIFNSLIGEGVTLCKKVRISNSIIEDEAVISNKFKYRMRASEKSTRK